jgi:hypothetical protein
MLNGLQPLLENAVPVTSFCHSSFDALRSPTAESNVSLWRILLKKAEYRTPRKSCQPTFRAPIAVQCRRNLAPALAW